MNEEILKQIAENTSPKYSKMIIVSDNKTQINTTFSPPLELHGDWEMALVNLETYYSFPNVRNATFEYFNTREWKTILIPTGSYEIESLNDFIKRKIEENKDDKEAIELLPNRSTLKTIVNIKNNYKVRFSNKDKLRKILGFKVKEITNGHNESDSIANILDINTILVHLNIITGSYVNGNPIPVIYSFFPNVSPGYKIVERPRNLIYLPIAMKTIKDFRVTLTDQDNDEINLRGEELTIKFHMKQI